MEVYSKHIPPPASDSTMTTQNCVQTDRQEIMQMSQQWQANTYVGAYICMNIIEMIIYWSLSNILIIQDQSV